MRTADPMAVILRLREAWKEGPEPNMWNLAITCRALGKFKFARNKPAGTEPAVVWLVAFIQSKLKGPTGTTSQVADQFAEPPRKAHSAYAPRQGIRKTSGLLDLTNPFTTSDADQDFKEFLVAQHPDTDADQDLKHLSDSPPSAPATVSPHSVRLERATAEQLSIVVWGLAKAGLLKDATLRNVLADQLLDKSHELAPCALVDVLWAVWNSPLKLNPQLCNDLTKRVAELVEERSQPLEHSVDQQQSASHDERSHEEKVPEQRLSTEVIVSLLTALVPSGALSPKLLDALSRLLVANLVLSTNKTTAMNVGHIADVIWAIAKARRRPPAALLTVLSSQLLLKRRWIEPKQISIILWSLAKCGILTLHTAQRAATPPDAVSQCIAMLLEQATEKAMHFNAKDLTHTLWALATAGVSNHHKHKSRDSERKQSLHNTHALVAALCLRGVQLQNTLTHQGISMCLWSFAKLRLDRHSHGNMFLHALINQAKLQRGFTAEGIATSLWALASIDILRKQGELAALLCTRVTVPECRRSLQARHISNILWALEKAELRVEPWLVTILTERAVVVQRHLNPHSISTTLWALSKASVRLHNDFLHAISRQTVLQAKDFQPRDIATLLSALVAICVKPDKHSVMALAKQAIDKRHLFNAKQLTDTMRALAKTDCLPDQELMRILRLLSQAAMTRGTTSRKNMVTTLWELVSVWEQSLVRGNRP